MIAPKVTRGSYGLRLLAEQNLEEKTMAAVVREMFAVSPTGQATLTIDLGQQQTFLAWGTFTWLDPQTDFDKDNAAAIDITHIDGARTSTRLSGGDHLGDAGAFSNLHQGALVRFGRRITFRLRAFHTSDFNCFGYGIVITNP
jgi:hypothetical protein